MGNSLFKEVKAPKICFLKKLKQMKFTFIPSQVEGEEDEGGDEEAEEEEDDEEEGDD